jgi:hypothetical protein
MNTNDVGWRLATMNEIKDEEGYAGTTHTTPERLLPKAAPVPPTEGWSYLFNSPKWHYFRAGRSLCKRWMILGRGEFEQGKDNSPDNCKACIKAVEKEKARAAGK